MPDNRELLKRITARTDVFGGKPIIRDMRISVELILGLMSQGASQEELLDDYPELEPEDILACIAYAHTVISGDTLAHSFGHRTVRFIVDRCAGRRLAEWLQGRWARCSGHQEPRIGPRGHGPAGKGRIGKQGPDHGG